MKQFTGEDIETAFYHGELVGVAFTLLVLGFLWGVASL